MVHCNRPLLHRIVQVCSSSTAGTDAIRGGGYEEPLRALPGKFGLVRHRRAFKSFCSRKCVDHYKVWLRAEVGKRRGWSDCLWSASLGVIPYIGEKSAESLQR